MRQALQILVDAIPDAALRPLLLELLQNGATSAAPSASADGHKLPDVTEPAPPAPATRRGWPRGKPRKTAAAGETAAERTARLALKAAAQRPPEARCRQCRPCRSARPVDAQRRRQRRARRGRAENPGQRAADPRRADARGPAVAARRGGSANRAMESDRRGVRHPQRGRDGPLQTSHDAAARRRRS
jgi:hypothetical protein